MSERIIEYSSDQTDTILTLVVNLHWDLVRDMINVWTNMDINKSKWSVDKIKRGQKLVDNFQELESIVKGVPIA